MCYLTFTNKTGCNGQKVGCFLDDWFKWTKSRLFFYEDNLSQNYAHNFTTSSEAEVGSAGEQPARNTLMLEVNTSK